MNTPANHPASTPAGASASVAGFAAANLSRATGAGLDPHEYLRVTGELADLDHWGEAFMRAARAHLARAERAAGAISAGEHFRTAARWFHVATLGPGPDGALAAAEADAAMGRALDLLEPGARRIEGPNFTGWLRGPAAAPATVVVVPGLDSGKEEFHDLIDALLRRGMAVFAMDGPGQGVRAATTTVRADYHQVIGQVADALGVAEVGLVGLSLGGYYVAESAAREPRVAAAVTVSGPFRLRWDDLPHPVRDLLSRRAGGEAAARRFAGQVDLSALAPRITCPLLVVDGGQDVIPGVTDGESLARLARHGQYVRVPHGDHLLGNARPDWLPAAADWMSAALTKPAPPAPPR
ncbi:alpha/beta hydrolase family protein [Nonomuraea rhodomycinica]|uniref:Alpha/beta fold hydrolase n=1 Tax=Nonomuraea rhodomycinica TaxID=1712872 RepID=A0A7Y6MFG3_9ACTN|nr:alpha/beta fold hydrolase [Nonomuraea rhodomycinica]NUW44626.1 alpha/beta fold hydrolase [Nonomuraea rhodomycinica]